MHLMALDAFRTGKDIEITATSAKTSQYTLWRSMLSDLSDDYGIHVQRQMS